MKFFSLFILPPSSFILAFHGWCLVFSRKFEARVLEQPNNMLSAHGLIILVFRDYLAASG